MKITLSKPPSTNQYWRFTSKPYPHWYISEKGKLWRTHAVLKLREVFHLRQPIASDIELNIDLYTMRNFDLDNCLKAALDALPAAQVILDDAQVVGLVLHKYKAESKAEERLELELCGY